MIKKNRYEFTSLWERFSDILSKSNRIVFEQRITFAGADWAASWKNEKVEQFILFDLFFSFFMLTMKFLMTTV